MSPVLVYVGLVMQLLIRVAISELGNVEHGLTYHLSKCMVPHMHIKDMNNSDVAGNNAIHVLQQISFCWKATLYRCKEHHKESYAYIYKYPVCGVVNTGMQLVPSKWILNVYFQFGVHITFREFNLPCTKQCDQLAVSVGSSMHTVWNELWKFKFCGKRAPWSMSQSQPSVNIAVTSQSDKISYGVHFMLLYEAIDIKSPLIEKVHANFLYKAPVYANVPNFLHKVPIYANLSTVIMFGNQYRTPQHIIHTYHFTARAFRLEVICIKFSRDMDIKLFDGPGPLSRAVNITHKNLNTEFCFSRFLGYAEISHHNMASAGITYWVKKSGSYSLGSCQRSIDYPNNESFHFKARDTGAGVHCLWAADHKFEELQIRHMFYQGYDMHFDSLNSLCQYGGLHVFFEIDLSLDHGMRFAFHLPFISYCTSINQKPTIPFDTKISFPIARTYILFTTFDKYSTGHMEVSLMQSDCEVYDVHFHESHQPAGNFFPQRFPDGQSIDEKLHTDSEKIPHCKGFWISGKYGRMVQNKRLLTFTFNDLNKALLIGTHKAIIHNWVIPETQLIAKPVDNDYYNFIMNATVPRDFPLDMTLVQKGTIVQRDKVAEAFLPHLRRLDVCTNYSGTDLHKTIVRIKFFQNRICYSPMKRLENIPLGINQLYFSPRRLANKAIGYGFEDTRTTANCVFMLQGKSCEGGIITHADVVIDHFYTGKNVTVHHSIKQPWYKTALRYTEYSKVLDKWVHYAFDIKLNISLYNKTHQCPKTCSLDITIWENLEFTPKVVRMLKWENISVLLWRVQATKDGFRLQIHQKCSLPCVHMCDVAVDIMVYEEHINCLRPYKDFSGEVSAEITGSWNDANAYCEQRGMQLLPVTSNGEEESVDDFSKLVCSLTKQQGLLLSELTVFMGLYKSQQVGFCPNNWSVQT